MPPPAKGMAALQAKAEFGQEDQIVNPQGYRVSTNNWNRDAAKSAREAVAFVNATTAVESGAVQHSIPMHVGSDGLRAYHVDIDTTQYGKRGIHGANSDPTRTWVHEIGHNLESIAPTKLKARAREFIDHRIKQAGSTDVNLKSKYGGSFDQHEVGNADGFLKLFEQLDGEQRAELMALYAGKRYSDGQNEVTSMLLERLFVNPSKLAQADPEAFRFIVGLLRGYIR